MSTTFYPVILVAQSPTGNRMKLVYSEEEMAEFYLQFNIPENRIISMPTLQNWFSKKIEEQNALIVKSLQAEGFPVADPAFYKDEGDYTAEKRVIIRKALEIFGNEEKAESWLNRRNRVLKNKKPTDLYRNLSGLVRVNDLLLATDKRPVQ